MNSISLALFDMDDVLCHYDRSLRVRSLAALSGRTEREVANAIWDSGLEAKADAGAVTDAEYLFATGRLLGYEISENDWLSARKAAMSPNYEVLNLAKEAANRCQIAVLTNNPAIVSSNIEYLCPEIASVFGNHVYASASFSAAKPDVEVFHRCLEKLRALPHETLFVDDLPDNIAGARLAGLNVHHFTGHRSLADALALRGLICAA